jgi:hypothetical protein
MDLKNLLMPDLRKFVIFAFLFVAVYLLTARTDYQGMGRFSRVGFPLPFSSQMCGDVIVMDGGGNEICPKQYYVPGLVFDIAFWYVGACAIAYLYFSKVKRK